MRLFVSVLFAAFLCGLASEGRAQDGDCVGEKDLLSIARAGNMSALTAVQLGSGAPYRVRLAYLVRQAQLSSGRRKEADRALLRELPGSEDERDAWRSLPTLACSDIRTSDEKFIGRLVVGAPKTMSAAALRNPDLMDRFLTFAYLDAEAADSLIVDELPALCKRGRSGLLAAMKSLPPDRRRWMSTRIIDPKSCQLR